MDSSYALAGPLAPGKSDELRRFVAEVMGPRRAEHDDYMRRYHLVKEFGWIQPTPGMGDMYVLYFESTVDFLQENPQFARSSHPFDVWYRQTAGSILGVDFTQPLPQGFVESLWDARSAMVTGRERPVGSVVPILPGKMEALRLAMADIAASGADEMQRYLGRFGTAHEVWFAEHAPQMDALIYVAEQDDPVEALRRFGESQDPFDTTLKRLMLDATGIDFNQPYETVPELVLEARMPVIAGVAGR